MMMKLQKVYQSFQSDFTTYKVVNVQLIIQPLFYIISALTEQVLTNLDHDF